VYKKIALLGLIIVSTYLILGCSQPLTKVNSTMDTVTLMDLQGQEIASTANENSVSIIAQVLNERMPMKEKILPIFEYEIRYKDEQWLITTNGYIRDNTVENGEIFKLKQATRVVELITSK